MDRSISKYMMEMQDVINKEIPTKPLAGGIKVKTSPQIALKDKQVEMPQPKKVENPTPPASLDPKTSIKPVEKSGDGTSSSTI